MKYTIKLLFGFLAYITVNAQPDVEFVPVNLTGPSLSEPMDIAGAGDNSGRLFIVERAGRIRIIQNNVVLPGYFLDINTSVITNGECGLLGLVFHPDFPATPYFYVYYMRSGPVARIARFTVSPGSPNDVDESTEFVIIDIPSEVESVMGIQYNHKGGDIAFGPDGYLYIAIGDGGSGGDPDENGQDSLSLLGKLLRLDIDGGTPYAIPPGNPGIGKAGYADEIWFMGLRNPWRFSFDRMTGDLWIGDVGQGAREEIDFIASGTPGGVNLGWDCYEGTLNHELTNCLASSNYTFPIHNYPRSCINPGNCPNGYGSCVIGGFVYRGTLFPELQGYYVCADYSVNNFWVLSYDGSSTTVHWESGSSMFSSLTTFGEDDNGELFAATEGGVLLRVTGGEILPVYLTHFEARAQQSSVLVRWYAESVTDITSFTIERSTRGFNFESIGTLDPIANNNSYAFTDYSPEPTLNYYRLVYTLTDGATKISEARVVDLRQQELTSEVYTHISGGLAVRLFGKISQSEILLYTTDGRLLNAFQTSDQYYEIPGTIDLLPGIYLVAIKTTESTTVHKWLKRNF